MGAGAGDLFPRCLREFVRPCLRPRGYTQAGRTYKKTQAPATAHLVFLRYTGAHSGRFDVRMTLTLDPYSSDLGPLVVEDLSHHMYGSVSRPDKVAALSHCYEAMGAWDKALDAWRDYLTTLHDPSNLEDPSVRKANDRWSYLEERSRV
jgi:hypothetical protein